MSGEKGSVILKKPVSLLHRELKLNFRDAFKSLSKAIIDGATQNWPSFAKDIVDSTAAVGFRKDEGETAYLLVYRSLVRAFIELSGEISDRLVDGLSEKSDALSDIIEKSLREKQIEIDISFFDNPGAFPYLDEVKESFEVWLSDCGLNAEQAASASGRLPRYFVNALHNEWKDKSKFYVPLLEIMQRAEAETPFIKSVEWGRYYAFLQKQTDESMMGEPFSLRQVYVPLRAYYEKRIKKGKGRRETTEERMETAVETERYAVWLEDYIDEWLKNGDKENALKIVSGGPGCGKSSFAKMYAAKAAEEGKHRVTLIPLHLFDCGGNLPEEVGYYFKNAEFFDRNPIDDIKDGQRLLMIFDGLDELSMKGKLGAETARQFIDQMQKALNQWNTQRLRVQAIISGREIAVQEHKSLLREPEQILTALEYHITEEKRKEFKAEEGLLEIDQRDEWWKNFGEASGEGYSTMPKDLKDRGKEIEEITAQPLLNYLFASTYVREGGKFAELKNMNEIYYSLLEHIYERAYEKREHRTITEIEEDDFYLILEEIALSMRHGLGRTTSIRAIEEHCKKSGLTELLKKFEAGAEKGIVKLLTAFYFREYGESRREDRTFEFTHKSFGEYLTAKRIVREAELIDEELRGSKEKYGAVWNEGFALKRWAETCGPTAIDEDLFKFVRNEVELLGKEKAGEIQKTFIKLINYILRNGMPMEELKIKTYREMDRQARNGEEALLAILSACADVAEKMSDIDWLDKEYTPALWISRLMSAERGFGEAFAKRCLNRLNLERSWLHFMRLDFSNLTLVKLESAYLRSADLGGADLRRAYLGGANLYGANLYGANLEGADLIDANLGGADLRGADLRGANLRSANLIGANLEGANIEGAEMAGAFGEWYGKPRGTPKSKPEYWPFKE